jgi:hypothetical protein
MLNAATRLGRGHRLLPERLGEHALYRRDGIPPTLRKRRNRISRRFRLLAKVLKAAQVADGMPWWRDEGPICN